MLLFYGIEYKGLIFISQIYKRISSIVHYIDETIIQIGNHHLYWLWIAIELVH